MGNSKWELIEENTYRTPVFGGWIVLHKTGSFSSGLGSSKSESMVFIPDKQHEWNEE